MTGKFLTSLDFALDFTDPNHPAVLRQPLIFESKTGRVIEVPSGFHSELASIPALARPVIGTLERHAPASVIHGHPVIVSN